jgi:hypothetical protein
MVLETFDAEEAGDALVSADSDNGFRQKFCDA